MNAPLAPTAAARYPRELTGLRGLAAIYVLYRHTLEVLPHSFVDGLLDNRYGVKLFMIISGFSICWLLSNRPQPYRQFIVARAFRIFPVYLVGLAVSTLMLGFVRQTLEGAPPTVFNAGWLGLIVAARAQLALHIAAHVTLLHGMVPDSVLPGAAFTLLGQSWSLSIEWQFYLLAPFAVRWVSTLERRTSQVCLLGLVAVLLGCGRYLSDGFLGNNLAMFSLGIASYELLQRYGGADDRRRLSGALAAMLALAAVWDVSQLPTIVIWTTTFYAATALPQRNLAALISRGLCAPATQYLGRISYAFYVSHMAALFLCLRVIDEAGVPPALRYGLLFVASLAVTIAFAHVLHRSIERPFRRIGKTSTTATPVAAVPLPSRSTYCSDG